MGGFLGFLLLNGHATFLAVVSALAFSLLVLDNAHALHILAAVNARHVHIGANCFMPVDFLPNAFGLAMAICLAFNRGKFAAAVMSGNFLILQHLCAPHAMISALELHFLELFFNFLFDAKELRFYALHRAHACFVVELLQAFVMETLLARLALNRVH